MNETPLIVPALGAFYQALGPWAESAVGAAFKTEDKGLVGDAIKLCRDLRLESASGRVEELSRQAKSQEVRTAAVDALPALLGNRAVATIVANVNPVISSTRARRLITGKLKRLMPGALP